MPTTPPAPKKPRNAPLEDRRAAPGSKGPASSLRWVKGALGRPLGLERRGSQLHVVLVDRRRKPAAEQPLSISHMRAELQVRLLAHEHGQAAHVMRHLVYVHDELGRKGWPGVEALPGQVVGKALVQAEMLASEESSASLVAIIERLRLLKAAADVREERKLQARSQDAEGKLDVSEATQEDFEMTKRHWAGTEPDGVAPANADK